MRSSHRIVIVSIAAALLLCPGVIARADDEGFSDKFDVTKSDFASVGRNDYFILEPGYQCIYEGTEDGKPGRLVISVLDETKKVDGVETRIVEERESSDGKLIEVSRNYFAIDKSTNDVYYFGEAVDEYKDGQVHSHGGSWESGKSGAHYGMFMPAKPAVGQKYYQELAPKVAMDRFEIVSMSETVKVPAGTFENCLKTKETTPLEPETTEYKLYAKGIGLIVDSGMKLVKSGKNIEAKADRRAKKSTATTEDGATPIVPLEDARNALAQVGADPDAEAVWIQAINDPALSAHARQDLIEDLNEQGFQDPHHVTADELPIVLNRIALIEDLAPDAMDQVNYDAFREAYKDLTNIAEKLTN